MGTQCIYTITNVVSNRCYVGSTIDHDKRWRQHRCDLRKGRHHSFLLQRAYNKHGLGVFRFEVVEVIADAETLETAEQRWMMKMRPFYNASLSTNRHCLGRKLGPCSEETREKLRRANTGYRHSEEAKARMSAKQKGRKRNLTPEQRAVLAERLRLYSAGRTVSQETRERLAQVQRGVIQNAAWREKRSRALTGRPWSAARRAATPLGRRWRVKKKVQVLTRDQAEEIRSVYAAGGISQQALALRYGVSQTTVWQIAKGETWR